MFSILNRGLQNTTRLILSEKNKNFIFVASYLKLRHNPPLDNFSHIFHHIFKSSSLVSSVQTTPSAEAHIKTKSCWIDRNFFKSRYRNYHKCIKSTNNCISENFKCHSRYFVSIENFKKMVWITDLDNPKVWLAIFKLYEFIEHLLRKTPH